VPVPVPVPCPSRARPVPVPCRSRAGPSAGNSHLRAGALHNDSAMGWEQDLDAKHGRPLDDIERHMYVLHYDEPRVVKSVSGDYAGRSPRSDGDGWLSATAIRHYVGWTQQRLPRKRINRHGPAAPCEIVYLEPGTMRDEQSMKDRGICPRCGEPLAPSLAELNGSTAS
jgi:hypothetical protein